MKTGSVLLAVSLSVLLVACDADTQESKQAEGVVPDYQMQALDKARGVEQSLQDAEQTRREQEPEY